MAKNSRIQTNKNSFLKQLIYLLIVFLGGYFAATAVEVSNLTHWINKTFLGKKNTQNLTTHGKAVNRIDLPKPKLEFYTLLAKEPNAQPAVKIPSPMPQQQPEQTVTHDSRQTTPPLSSQAKASYVVQIAAFKNKQDAERMKAELLLKGFEASIVQAQNDDWFRVTIGPFYSRSEAQKTQVNLVRNEHIKGMLRKLDT